MKAKLRVCMRCEWVFLQSTNDGCPKCRWAHYGARSVYGNAAYRYIKTQDPWRRKKMDEFSNKLDLEIRESMAVVTSSLDNLK